MTFTCFNPDISVKRRIQLLEGKIRKFISQLQRELKKEKIMTDDVLDALTFLPIELKVEYEDCIYKKMERSTACSSVRQVFHILINPLTTFLDYQLLEHLISVFGGSQLKQDMAGYVDEVNDFKKETTVAKLMDHLNGIEDKTLNFKELEVRFGEDPTMCTLEKLDKHRKKFCSRYKLSELVMILICLKPGSFIAVWRIPSILVCDTMESAIRKDDPFMDEEGILSVAIAGKQIYPGICYVTNST